MDNSRKKNEILDMIEREDVEFIRLQFTDMFGNLKNIAVTASQMEKAIAGRCRIDGAALRGFDLEDTEELFLMPDLDTFCILPWRPQQGKVARLLCDIYRADQTIVEESPRYILKKTLARAAQLGYRMGAAFECEFFLFHTDEEGRPTTLTHEKAGYLDLSPLDLGENARRDIVLTLEDMGYEVESSSHEKAAGQHQIDFCQSTGLAAGDSLATFKTAVRTVAKRHGLHATFMPKPINNVQGSGMHLKLFLYRDGQDVFAAPDGVSLAARQFMAGLLRHTRAMAAVTNPLVNSYKRLVPGYEAPTGPGRGREALVLFPMTDGAGQAVEFRLPDASANPYLALALCVEAGLDGIQNSLDPAAEQVVMPENLSEAIGAFAGDPLIRRVLGDGFVDRYVKEKKNEWGRYCRHVTGWEIEEYLYRI